VKKKRISIGMGIIASYFIVHGCLYTLNYFTINFMGVWDRLFSFIFGNATLHTIFIILPILVGLLYIGTGLSILYKKDISRVIIVVVSVFSIFFAFPIGSILGIMIIIYSFTPAFSKFFPFKTKKQTIQLGGITLFVFSLISLLILSGFASGVLTFTTYKISGYDVSYDSPESKIEDITQRIGVLDVLVELTASIDYATEQQDEVLIEISDKINRVVKRFTETSNSMIVNLEASNLLDIASNKNIKKITPVVPTFQIAPYEISTTNLSYNIPQQLNVDELWAEGLTGRNITIAIMDTGIKENHPDLQRNGRSIVVGGLHLHGEYVHPHGTMVASCIANQNPEFLGVAPEVNLLNVEVFKWSTSGGIRTLTSTNSDILQGFEYIANWKKLTGDFVILSCSWGVSALSWQHDADVCTEAANRLAVQYNIPVIASAGNSGPSFLPHIPIPFQIASPSGADNVLAVGAIDNISSVAGFSSRGPYYTGSSKPDVVAFGVNVPVLSYQGLITASGTSFSCPYVSGVVALLAQENKELSSEQLYDAIRNGAKDLGITGYDYDYGFGIVDAQASFDYIQQTIPPFNTSVFFITLLVFGLIFMLVPALIKK
jgi:subtilisin family serine protease